MQKIGEWAFNIGVVIALVLGFVSSKLSVDMQGWLAAALVLMGIIVGAMNVTGAETKDFLLVAAVLILAATGATTLKAIPMVGDYLVQTFAYLMIFIVPATLVVALKAVYRMSKDA